MVGYARDSSPKTTRTVVPMRIFGELVWTMIVAWGQPNDEISVMRLAEWEHRHCALRCNKKTICASTEQPRITSGLVGKSQQSEALSPMHGTGIDRLPASVSVLPTRSLSRPADNPTMKIRRRRNATGNTSPAATTESSKFVPHTKRSFCILVRTYLDGDDHDHNDNTTNKATARR